MGKPAPHGPLLGDELGWAIKLLTDKQYRAYRYRREGHAWNWIAQRMGISRQAVIHHVAKAEKRLGYTPTVTAKQRAHRTRALPSGRPRPSRLGTSTCVSWSRRCRLRTGAH
jgi:DNA-binding CsgD family transcriptional regulator